MDKKTYKLSDMSDEQLNELMDSVLTDDEADFSSSDEDEDPTYVPGTPDKRCISLCIEEMNAAETSDAFLQNISTTFHVSTLEEEATPSTSIASTSKALKRKRSPLPVAEKTGPVTEASAGGFNRTSLMAINNKLGEVNKIVWRKSPMVLHVNEIAFRGDTQLPSSITDLNIMDMIARETNHAAHQENITTAFATNTDELRQYIGILMYMSVYRYPSLDSYWGKNAFPPIQKTMPVKKFMAIKKYLSFQDETKRVKKGDPGYDALFRIRELANKLNERFNSIPKRARLCIDEQMCSTKIKHHLRQYMPNKPHKWGIKLFVLCDSFGYSYVVNIFIKPNLS